MKSSNLWDNGGSEISMESLIKRKRIKKPSRYTTEYKIIIKQEIKDLIDKNYSSPEIAKKLKTFTGKILELAREFGFIEQLLKNAKLNQGKREFKDLNHKEVTNKIIILINQNKTTTKIAKILKLSRYIVKKLVKSTGDTTLINKQFQLNRKSQTKPKFKIEIVNKMIELSIKGYGVDTISRKLSYPRSSVVRLLRKFLGDKVYEQHHPIEKYTTGWNARYFYNDRGDYIQSSYEEFVADILFEAKIPYICHPDPLFFGRKRIFPDFIVGNKFYIEVFGMTNRPFYVEKMNRKIKLYNENNINHFFLFEKDCKYNKYKRKTKNKILQECKKYGIIGNS